MEPQSDRPRRLQHDRKGDPNYEVFVSTGLPVPAELESLPRKIFTTDPEDEKFYDQIAWLTKGSSRLLTLGYNGSAGSSAPA